MKNQLTTIASMPSGAGQAAHLPMQPVVMVGGVARFKENRIVTALYREAANHGLDMNGIARGDFTDEDRMQFVQLIGYSVSGYGELSYVSDESFDAADAARDAAFLESPAPADKQGFEPFELTERN